MRDASIQIGLDTLCRNNFIRPHHFIVLVFEDVTMIHVLSGIAFKAHDETREHHGVHPHSVLPSGFVRLGRLGWADKPHPAGGLVRGFIEGPPIQNLEPHQMHVDRMRILGRVADAPDFC